MSRFQFGDSDESASDLDDDPTDLPFPEPLSRAAFLASDFDPATYLSSLKNRHQTLEDLRQELRDLDQLLSKELLDLVNENYQDFLSLGTSLRGGDEKTEEVHVGLLAFQRDVTAIREKVDSRRRDVQELLTEKKRLRGQANVGKVLLDYADRIDELEHTLLIADISSRDRQVSDSDSDLYSSESGDDSDDEEGLANGATTVSVVSLKRLERNILKYAYLTTLSTQLDSKHPFLQNQQARVAKIRSTLLLDLRAALEQAKQAGDRQDSKTATVMRLYALMGEEASVVDGLKKLNTQG